MSLPIINKVMSENSLNVQFESFKKEGNLTNTTLDRATAQKVCQVLRENGIGAKIINEHGAGSGVRVTVPRSSIAATSSAAIGKDVSDLAVHQAKGPTITDDAAFRKTFSWPNASRSGQAVNDNAFPTKISYKQRMPQYDNKDWNPFIDRLLGGATTTYSKPEVYINCAQVLLNRFLDNNPQFLDESFQDLHPTLMFQALATTIKVEEDVPVWNSDFAACVNQRINPIEIRNDIHAMESMFLRGIEWNIHADIPVEEDMKSMILQDPVAQDAVKLLLEDKPVGAYIIQGEDDHYIVEIKTGDDQFATHRFTFGDTGNPMELLGDDNSIPKTAYDVDALISQWGGRNLIT